MTIFLTKKNKDKENDVLPGGPMDETDDEKIITGPDDVNVVKESAEDKAERVKNEKAAFCKYRFIPVYLIL